MNKFAPKVAMIVWNEFRNDARVLKEARTLQSAGYRVTVHALHTPGVTRERETLAGGIAVVRVARSPLWKIRKRGGGKGGAAAGQKGAVAPSGPLPRLGPWRRFLRIVARLWTHFGLAWRMIRLRPDVVHAHDVNTLPTAWLVARISRARLVYDAHEISTGREGYAEFRRLVGWVEKKIMPRAAGTITTTDARAKFFARAYHVPRPLVLQNRPDLQIVPPSDRIRRELGLAEEWPIVVYQGGLQQGRGLARLVEAAALVPAAYFVFIGGGRLEQELKERVTKLQLAGRVYFIPTVPLAELPHYTASADIGAQPIENTCLNHFTTDSNKLFEYVMAGLPVVASDLPEIRRVVREHDLGLLVPAGDTEALAGAINTLVADGARREHYRRRAEKARQALSWQQQEHALVELYQKVLA